MYSRYSQPMLVAGVATCLFTACQSMSPVRVAGEPERIYTPDAASASVEWQHTGTQQAPQPAVHATSEPGAAAGSASESASSTHEDASGAQQADTTPDTPSARSSVVASPSQGRETAATRSNPNAEDLLDHWGHRRAAALADALSTEEPARDDAGGELLRLLRVARARSTAPVAPALLKDDVIQPLGERAGVAYGRWSGGPADTLSIDFTYEEASPEVRDDPAMRAMVDRAGKMWSRRIDDTWTTWTTTRGEETVETTGLEIEFIDQPDLGAAGTGGQSGRMPLGAWQPRFGTVRIDRAYLAHATETSLFSTLTHEIGHVLGAWGGFDEYTDEEAGMWTGPNVMALHGGPAPFQDDDAAFDWVNGERDPNATQFDFAHSGVCASLMAYCSNSAALPALLPHDIDFAFLADLGMTIIDETTRPETYGLVGWTEHAAFTIAVARTLDVGRSETPAFHDRFADTWSTLDVLDTLEAGADAFGEHSTGTPAGSLGPGGAFGKVWYRGGLIGAAIGFEGMPPVTGDATLSVDLDTADGTASFTSLVRHAATASEPFAGGALHYPLTLSGNTLATTYRGATLSADFYGPRHDDIAGTLNDVNAGILAAFGTTRDTRPTREDLAVQATYLSAFTIEGFYVDETVLRSQWNAPLRCSARDGCKQLWGNTDDWTPRSLDEALGAIPGWDQRESALPNGESGAVRFARQTYASTDGRRGRHVIDVHTATLEYGTFGVGLEAYSSEWEAMGAEPHRHVYEWAGSHGVASGGVPQRHARWSGHMLGLNRSNRNNTDWLLHGTATIDYDLDIGTLDVAFSDISSLDGTYSSEAFGFSGVAPNDDGTFSQWTNSGQIDVAFLGPEHEETVGAFRDFESDVWGSFGARALPTTVTVEETGVVHPETSFHTYESWGLWAQQFGDALVTATIEQRTTERLSESGTTITSYYPPHTQVEGTPTGSNPIAGGAVWTGEARAFDRQRGDGWAYAIGKAQLEVDFATATIDAALTGFGADYPDLAWEGLALHAGSFAAHVGARSIDGAFYGREHQSAAGEFTSERLRGVFAAARE